MRSRPGGGPNNGPSGTGGSSFFFGTINCQRGQIAQSKQMKWNLSTCLHMFGELYAISMKMTAKDDEDTGAWFNVYYSDMLLWFRHIDAVSLNITCFPFISRNAPCKACLKDPFGTFSENRSKEATANYPTRRSMA